MPEPTAEELAAKRDQLVDGHLDVYASTLALLDELPDERWDQPTGCPGWSVRGVVSHMIGVEKLMLGDPFPEFQLATRPAHVKNDFGAFTEIDVALRADRAPAELIDEATEVFGRRRSVLESMSPTDLGEQIRGLTGEDVAARVLGTRLFDLWAHEQDIRRAVDRPGHLQGHAADTFWKRANRGLGRQLPERLDGVGELTILIDEPDERTMVSAVGHGEPVGLTMDLSNFAAHVCGRDDARPDAVAVAGDQQAAARALASLSLTP